MSWLFSRALVVAFSPPRSSQTRPSAQLNVMLTPHSFWRNGKTMDCSRFSRFGLTYAPLTQERGEALLIAYRAASRAKTLASPARATDSTASDPDSGASSSGLFAMLSPDGSEWRTLQCSLLEGSESFSQTWPRSGSMRDGMCYLRPTLAPRISVSAYGFLLPTLTVKGNDNRPYPGTQSGYGLASALKLFPTLTASDTGERKRKYAQGGTPLSLAVKLMPALVHRDWRHPGRSRIDRTGSKAGECLPQVINGPLNPDWCEWFMGWPVGWTASSPLAMAKFQEWRRQHSPRSQLNEEAA